MLERCLPRASAALSVSVRGFEWSFISKAKVVHLILQLC